MMYRKLCKDTTNERNNIGLTLIFRYFTKIACNLLLVYVVCGNKKRAIVRLSLFLSGRHDSNVRPLGPKPSILPTVLRPECFRKSECKVSASRTIFQIYLRKSEAQPILKPRSGLKSCKPLSWRVWTLVARQGKMNEEELHSPSSSFFNLNLNYEKI